MSDVPSTLTPEGGSTLRHYVDVVWRRRWLLVVPIVVLPLVVLVASLRQHDVYEATADVLVNRQEAATTSLIGQTPALEDPGRSIDTQVRLARTPIVVERVLAAAGEPDDSVHAFINRTSVFPLADILRFSVTDADARQSEALATEYARQFVRYRRQLDTAGLARSIAELEAQLVRLEDQGRANTPLYTRLADRVGQLESLETLRSSNVLVVSTASDGDAEHVAPRPKRNTALAAVGGIVLGLVLVFLWESLSTRPRSRWEIEALLGMPLLASLTLPSVSGSRSSLPALGDAGGPSADAYHELRANLSLASAGRRPRVIMITSLRGDEGKDTTAANLGITLARGGSHVVLVDADMRAPSQAGVFHLAEGPGIASAVAGDTTLEGVLNAIPVGDTRVTTGSTGRLEVVTAEEQPARAYETLASGSFAEVVSTLAAHADIVLVDVPPVFDAPDAAAVSSRADGLVLVVDERRARRPELGEARRTIDAWQLAPLGFVLTTTAPERRPPRLSRRRATSATAHGAVRTERAT